MLSINKAINFAAQAHIGQVRKGSGVPYIIHPFAVGMILQQQKCLKELVIAGILHDTLEDTKVTSNDIKEAFGEYVTYLVEGCSNLNKHLPWEQVKQQNIDKLRKTTMDIKIIACADKLHNITSIIEDYQVMEEETWKKFKRGKDKQKWYYMGLAKVFSEQTAPENITIFDEFVKKVYDFFDS